MDSPVRPQPQDSERSGFSRLSHDGRTVIRKQPLGPGRRSAGCRTSWRCSSGSAASRGSRSSLDAPRYPGSIVMADAGDRDAGAGRDAAARSTSSSAWRCRSPGPSRDAPPWRDAPGHHPGERRARPRTARPAWSDFALATSLAEIRPALHPPQPRSSGRWPTSRPSRPGGPAARSTSAPTCTRSARRCTSWPPGAPPFGSGDPLRLTHDHLARVPAPPAEVEPGRPAAAVRDHHAPAREGAGPALPDRGGPGPRPRAAACAAAGGAARSGSASATSRCGCRRRRGWSAATRRWPRCSAAFAEAVAGRLPRGARRRRARRGQDRAGRRAAAGGDRAPAAGSWPASSTSTGATSSSTRSIRRCARWAGCCWPSRRRSWPRSATRILAGGRRQRGAADRARARSSRRCWACRPTRAIR